MTIDIRSLVEALAMNFGYLSIDAFHKVFGIDTDYYYYNGYEYIGNFYFDPLYEGMTPIYCVLNSDRSFLNARPSLHALSSICFLYMGNVTGLPIFLHFGAGNFHTPLQNSPKPCDWYLLYYILVYNNL